MIHLVMGFVNVRSTRGPFTHKQGIVFISNDLKHDADGVAHYLDMLYTYLQQTHPGLEHLEQYSDGCACQYRCARSFHDLSEHACKHKITITHNYFESCHRKSSADGLGAVIKYDASLAVTR
uniref:Uncharacterized protein n=1 Tax=Octopus bimaculoides TaxID=37653 RepID=A0A0L8GE63_OCTBM